MHAFADTPSLARVTVLKVDNRHLGEAARRLDETVAGAPDGSRVVLENRDGDEAAGTLLEGGACEFAVTHDKRRCDRILRLLDVVIASLLLLAWLPVHLVVAVGIKLTSRGPIFYRSKRIGRGGRPFVMWKYRTMATSNDDGIHRDYLAELYANPDRSALGDTSTVLKLDNDPRITRIGGLLRRTSLDEVPQLFNVLRGEMSLIGPRPCLDYEEEAMEAWARLRHAVRPGLSGWQQVEGRCRTSIHEGHFLDVLYVHARSPWLYLQLVLKTPVAVLWGKGAR